MSLDDEIWYAVNESRIVFEPKQVLETFGQTRIKYHVVCECLDDPTKSRVYNGFIVSEKPIIINPRQYAQEVIKGFGEEAQEYASWLIENSDFIKIMQYGLQLRKEELSVVEVNESVDQVLASVHAQVEKEDGYHVVIKGVEKYWELALINFMQLFIQKSAPVNLQNIQSHVEVMQRDAEHQQRLALENEFHEARGDRNKLQSLGTKLHERGVFEKYQDRFFALLREC